MNPRRRPARTTTARSQAGRQDGSASDAEPHCAIVALGASAGGLDAFQQFFRHMPPNSGMAFVLVQHLNPNHDTLIPELLANYTAMAIRQIDEGMKIEANQIYVMRPNSVLTVDGCTFRLVPAGGAGEDKMTIDRFFRSVAHEQTGSVVGVVLSGTGSDGTIGLREIKQTGGMTMVQSLETAKYPAMPRSAILAGVVDHVLPVEDMPGKILEYARHLKLARGISIDGGDEETAVRLGEIYPILHRTTGHDFSRYKQSTLIRRVQRRMQVLYFDSVPKYVEHLKSEPKEVEGLFKDLLIGVTEFFRDPDAFEALARAALAGIVSEKAGDNQVRIWVPGCASGEEAYSLAILMAEHAARLGVTPHVQIFATDLDTEALNFARKGVYAASIAEQVSPERLGQFFRERGDRYEVSEQLRSMCLFSPHNLIKDPPFSRLDLISCRNLLIYFESDLQKKLLPLFHYALNPSGYLFLGPSENIASRSELFRTLDKKHRIFQRQPTVLRYASVPLIDPSRASRASVASVAPQFNVSKDQNLARTIERVILEDYSPAAVIVNEHGDITYFSGRTGKYLEPSAGPPTNKLVALARKNLRVELRSALHRAVTTRTEVVRKNLVVKTPERVERINLVVRPLTELGKDMGLFIVLFQELPGAVDENAARPLELEAEHPVIQQLEHELRTTKEDLQTTIEELETSNEELKSANEELLSMNEELQSTNEELQTSKEELQSLNEELHHKVEELDAANADLQNLFESAQIGTLFLDTKLRLKRFTPAIQPVLRLDARDVGRPFAECAPDLEELDLATDMEEVLRTLVGRERQIALGRPPSWYVVRVLPYYTLDRAVEGIVVTFNDVTELNRLEEQRAQMAAIVEGSPDAIVGRSPDGVITSWNAGAERLYGYKEFEVVGRPVTVIVPPDREEELAELHRRLRAGEAVPPLETVRLTKQGQRVDVSVTASVIRDVNGRVTGFATIARNITERKRAEEEVRRSQRLLSDFIENATEGLHWLGPDGAIVWANQAELAMLGYPREEYVGRNFTDFHVDDATVRLLSQCLVNGTRLENCEARLRCKDGTIRHVLMNADAFWEEDRFVHLRCFTRDITVRKEVEERLHEETRLLETLNRIGPMLSAELDLEKLVQAVTDAATEVTGAQFGAFFYNVTKSDGESYTLYTISGVPREAFARFPMPRNTALFGPTFRGEAPIRIADVTKDPRYGKSDPHHGMPAGHLPVRSYLAAPVVARSGEVLGGLFFGHAEPGIFTERAEKLAVGIAAEAAVAIDNARLFQARARAEETLRATEQHLRAVIAATPECVKIVARDGTLLQMNKAGCAIVEADDEAAVLGRPVEGLVAPESRDTYQAMHERVCNGQPAHLEYEILGLKGTRRWMETNAVPLHDAGRGETVHLAVTRDITRRKEAERALRESEERFRQLADAMPQIVWTARPDGYVDYYNRRWYEFTNQPPAAGGDASWAPVLHPEDLAHCIALWSRAVATGEPYQIEYRFLHHTTGEYRWQLGRALPVRNDAGEVVRWFGTATDIHDQRQAQDALHEAQEKLSLHAGELERQVAERTRHLDQTVQSLEGVCYTMAHDLRAPLRALQSFSQILLSDYAPHFDAEGRSYAERIVAATARMDLLIRDLLDFARLSHTDLPSEPLDLNEDLKAIRRQLAHEIETRRATLQVDGPLPTVLANRTIVEQVFSNLIGNAMKFVPPERAPVVEIAAQVKDGVAVMCVSDNGIGIAAEHHERVFGLFQRLHAADTYPGTGIGLAIVRKGVERMGGRVYIRAQETPGTCFCVELPLAPA